MAHRSHRSEWGPPEWPEVPKAPEGPEVPEAMGRRRGRRHRRQWVAGGAGGTGGKGSPEGPEAPEAMVRRRGRRYRRRRRQWLAGGPEAIACRRAGGSLLKGTLQYRGSSLAILKRTARLNSTARGAGTRDASVRRGCSDRNHWGDGGQGVAGVELTQQRRPETKDQGCCEMNKQRDVRSVALTKNE